MPTTTRREWRRHLRGLLRAGLHFAAFSGLGATARADGVQGMSVAWSAPEPCPSGSEFHADIERFLGKSQAARDAKPISVSATVSQNKDGSFAAALQVNTVHGPRRRQLSHRDCRELTEATALVAALAIDPKLTLPEPQSPPPPAPPAPLVEESPPTPKEATSDSGSALEPPHAPQAQPAPPAPTRLPANPARDDARPRATSSDTALRPSLLVLGGAGSGALPGLGVGLGGRASAGTAHVRVAIRGMYWFPRFQPLQASAAQGADLSSWGFSVRPCWLPLPGAVALSLCFGPELGQVRGSGHGLEQPRTTGVRSTALEAEVAAVFRSSSGLTTELGVEAGKSLEKPRFGVQVDGIERQLYQAPSWLFQVYAGFGVFAGHAK